MRAAAIPEMAIRVHTLDNGLSVYLSENHEEPWVSCRIAVRAGAAQEPADATGLAHYLEHMLANKGTRSLGTRDATAEQIHLDRLRELYERLREADGTSRAQLLAQIDEESQAANRWAIANELKQIYALLGARSFNAFTSHDRTVFVVDVPSNRLEAWARLEGNRFAEPVFRGFPTELETIVEEKNRSLDNPARVLMMAANPLLWAGHPYARDVLGEVDHLLAPSIAQTERFFSTWYVPNNMAVVLAGDIDPDRALSLIERNFSDLRPAEVPAREAPPAPPLRGEQRVEVVHRGDEEVQLIWRTVPRMHPDAEALMLADMMLDNNSTGLLDTRLEQKQKVRSAGAYPNMRLQGGTATVWGRPRIEQSLDEVEALLREQVQALRNGEFKQSDLDDLIANFEVGELRKLESNEARASVMLDAFMFQRDWDEVRTRLARLADISREQVVETARRWLGDEMVVARRREGEPPVSRIPSFGLRELSLDSESRSPMFEQVRALPAKPLDLQVLREDVDFECTRTRAGLLYRTANPNNDLVQLTVRVHVGSVHDPLLSKSLDLWGRAGVGEMDLEQYRRALFRSAAAVSVECSRQQTDVTVAGRAAVIPSVLALVRERLRAPVLSQEDRDRWAADVVGKRKQRRETSDFKFTTLRQWALRGRRSPYLAESLRNEEVLALPLDGLRAAPGKLFSFEQVVVYAGPHERKKVVEMLELDREVQPEPAYELLRYEPLVGVRVFVVHHEAAQTKIGLFIPGEGYNTSHSPEYRVLHEYLGGSAGLVFQEIRESRGLAYAAHGGHTAGNRVGDQNLIWGSLASRPDRSAEAAEVLLGLFRTLPGKGMHAQRFERAWGAALERLLGSRVRFRGYGFAAESWRLRGQDHDPRVEILPALERFGMEDLRAFLRPLETAGVALVVVGDTARMDMQALARLGEIELRTLDELVVY